MNAKKIRRLLKLAVVALRKVRDRERHPQCDDIHASVAENAATPPARCRCAELHARDAVGMIQIRAGGASVIDSLDDDPGQADATAAPAETAPSTAFEDLKR